MLKDTYDTFEQAVDDLARQGFQVKETIPVSCHIFTKNHSDFCLSRNIRSGKYDLVKLPE